MGTMYSERTGASAGHLYSGAMADLDATRKFEQALMDLEDAVHTVLDAHKGHAFHDVDFLYWDRKLKNIATPISLALSECKGPRQFHYHYRHNPNDDEQMIPVMESPVGTLLKVCRNALIRCTEMVGLVDRSVVVNKIRLEQSIRAFINRYNASL
jgi:hypothetical protein